VLTQTTCVVCDLVYTHCAHAPHITKTARSGTTVRARVLALGVYTLILRLNRHLLDLVCEITDLLQWDTELAVAVCREDAKQTHK